MKWLAWLDEAADFMFSRPQKPTLTFPMLPPSPATLRAIEAALAGISADVWFESMMKVVDLHPAPKPWTEVDGATILSDIKAFAAREQIRYYEDMRRPFSNVYPLREEYAELLLRDTLNSTPFRISGV